MSRASIDIRQVRSHFSSHCLEYDRFAMVQKRVVERLTGLLRAEGPLSGEALEVGTGTGALARNLAGAFPPLHLTVSDIAHGMTRQAATSLGGVPAVDADAQALPFRAESFGLLVSSSVYQWVNDLPRAFAESWRVLERGGLFAFALFGERTLFELRESHRLAAAESGHPPSHVQDFPSPAEVRRALSAAGFEGARIISEDEVERHPDVATLLRNLKRIGASNASTRRPQGLAPRRIMHRMIDLYNERYGESGAVPATYEVIYGLGRRPR